MPPPEFIEHFHALHVRAAGWTAATLLGGAGLLCIASGCVSAYQAFERWVGRHPRVAELDRRVAALEARLGEGRGE